MFEIINEKTLSEFEDSYLQVPRDISFVIFLGKGQIRLEMESHCRKGRKRENKWRSFGADTQDADGPLYPYVLRQGPCMRSTR